MVPEGRRIVRVVMLNGRQVPFVVEVGVHARRETIGIMSHTSRQCPQCNSLCAELFQQVLSHQSLQEKRFFGLAISKGNPLNVSYSLLHCYCEEYNPHRMGRDIS